MRILRILVIAGLISGTAYAAAGASSLVDAVKSKDKDGVRTFLRQGADVKTPEADGTTALHWAVRVDDLDMADLPRAKFDFDVVGHYARPDVFRLEVNEQPMKSVSFH